MLRHTPYWVIAAFVKAKYFFLRGYYRRLGVQARYLYRSSQLFKERYQQAGLDYAESSFPGETASHFFWKAGKGPMRIRFQIFLDFLLNRPEQPYVIVKR